MPIYAYRCDACGFAKDVLQKMSEDPLTICPECHQASFKKQVTAAGFQLKGSGWYVTDFRGGSASGASTGAATGASSSGNDSTASETSTTSTESASPTAATSSTTTASSDKAA